MTFNIDGDLRVLLVEDEPANRALVRAIVARADPADLGVVWLHEVGTIADAHTFLAANTVDVVLVDVRLPDGNGLDLVAELRDHSGTDRPQVIVVSASVLPAQQSSALVKGADGFLGKPFNAADLIDLLKRLAVRQRDVRRPGWGALDTPATRHRPSGAGSRKGGLEAR
jgi:CheY-like chemotaxis protein